MDGEHVVEELERAVAAVLAADVPEPMQGAALTYALGHFESADLGASAPRGKTPREIPKVKTAEVAATEDPGLAGIDRIAAALTVDRHTLDAIYHAGESGLELVVSSRRLPASKGEATKVIAVLMTAGRQLGGWDRELTESEHVREACRLYSKFQSNHFAETLKEIDEYVALSGRGIKRQLKLLRPGRDRARELIVELSSTQGD